MGSNAWKKAREEHFTNQLSDVVLLTRIRKAVGVRRAKKTFPEYR